MTRIPPPQRKPDAPRRSPAGRFAAATGAAPAHSAVRLRVALALFGLVFCGVVAGLFAAADWPLPAALLCLVGATALVDLTVLAIRARRRRGQLPPSTGWALTRRDSSRDDSHLR